MYGVMMRRAVSRRLLSCACRPSTSRWSRCLGSSSPAPSSTSSPPSPSAPSSSGMETELGELGSEAGPSLPMITDLIQSHPIVENTADALIWLHEVAGMHWAGIAVSAAILAQAAAFPFTVASHRARARGFLVQMVFKARLQLVAGFAVSGQKLSSERHKTLVMAEAMAMKPNIKKELSRQNAGIGQMISLGIVQLPMFLAVYTALLRVSGAYRNLGFEVFEDRTDILETPFLWMSSLGTPDPVTMGLMVAGILASVRLTWVTLAFAKREADMLKGFHYAKTGIYGRVLFPIPLLVLMSPILVKLPGLVTLYTATSAFSGLAVGTLIQHQAVRSKLGILPTSYDVVNPIQGIFLLQKPVTAYDVKRLLWKVPPEFSVKTHFKKDKDWTAEDLHYLLNIQKKFADDAKKTVEKEETREQKRTPTPRTRRQ